MVSGAARKRRYRSELTALSSFTWCAPFITSHAPSALFRVWVWYTMMPCAFVQPSSSSKLVATTAAQASLNRRSRTGSASMSSSRTFRKPTSWAKATAPSLGRSSSESTSVNVTRLSPLAARALISASGKPQSAKLQTLVITVSAALGLLAASL